MPQQKFRCLKSMKQILLIVCCLVSGITSLLAQGDTKARVVALAPTEGGNDFYVGNQAPLLSSPFVKLPIGGITPGGWLRHQLELMADGFTGRLTEISKWCKFEENAWVNAKAEGQSGWEEVPYWLKGYADLGYVLQDKRIIEESTRWIEGVFASQDATGYFGPRSNLDRQDLWPNMIMLYVLRSYCETTGDGRVLALMTKYFRWLDSLPFDRFLSGSWQVYRDGDYYPVVGIPRYTHKMWQTWRGGDNLDHIYWLYNRTKEPWLLNLARVNHERTSDWTGGIPTWHGVNLCQGFREPAQYYQQTHDIRYLKATERNYDSIMTLYGQVPGGMFGADENARVGYGGPRQGAEACSMVEFMHSFELLVKITGNSLWADRCEDVAFNSFPASMTPDLKGLHYLTAPNMAQLDTTDKFPLFDNNGDMLTYNPWRYRCCQHNVAFGWPYYVEHLWMATQNNGLAAVLYGTSTVTAKVGDGSEVRVTETTNYPFDERVEFKFSLPKATSFPFLLRVPGWSQNVKVEINGKDINVQASPGSWIVLERTWKDGDIVRLELPMTISVKTWEKNNNAVSVYRGPLAYSLKIGERWERLGGTDYWPAFQVFPTSPWNYGLIIDAKDPAKSFKVMKKNKSMALQPFTLNDVPIELRAKGKRIPQWKLETNGLIGELQKSPVRSTEPVEDITLIPMGAARLRVSAFPVVSDSPDANVWK